MRGISARDLSAQLAARIKALVGELLPHGQAEGAEWVSPSIAGTSTRALSVRIKGSKAGVWADFSGGGRGDALDLVAHVLFRGSKKDAYRWALAWLGLAAGGPVARPQTPLRPPSAGPDAHERATRAAALRRFLEAEPVLRGSPVDHYLAGRGINLAELGRQPRALRYHPACRCSEADADLPAMLAAIIGPDGKHCSTHRTYLAQQGGKWTKAPLRAAKKSFGNYAGGFIPLWRGRSGRPLAEAPEWDVVVLCEGIEDGLSIALSCNEFRVLSTVSLANLGRIVLPDQVLDVIVAADNDTGNEAAEAQLQRAVDRLLAEGRSVRIARSSHGKDFNDDLRDE